MTAWHLDRANYSEQQIQEMPTWIKTNKEEYTVDEQYDVVDINSFSEMQKLAYDIVKSHFDDLSSEKEPLCLVINGVAGTGKSYLINAIRNLLQSKYAVATPTGKAAYNIRGVTVHSLLCRFNKVNIYWNIHARLFIMACNNTYLMLLKGFKREHCA